MNYMKTMLALALAAGALAAHAAGSEGPAAGSQQSRMATCNKEATGKKGDERRAFMKECLSSGKKAASGASQALEAPSAAEAAREKACKAEAKGLRGNARKDVIQQCLARPAA